MRRLATTLGILGATLALAVALPASAQAATGDLILNGEHFYDPSVGCLKIADSGDPAVIQNYTNARLLVLSGEDCTGTVVGTVNPQGSKILAGAKSVFVMD